jgi:hypothetical protein
VLSRARVGSAWAPVTVRANAELVETVERMRAGHVMSLIVSTPDGVLLGL